MTADWETKDQVLTEEEICSEHEYGDNRGWMDFARAIESMAIEAYKKKQGE
jgi:hypothetical protein